MSHLLNKETTKTEGDSRDKNHVSREEVIDVKGSPWAAPSVLIAGHAGSPFEFRQVAMVESLLLDLNDPGIQRHFFHDYILLCN